MKREEIFDLLISWENLSVLIQYLVDYPDQIHHLMDIALNDPKPISWRAVWLVDKIHETHPDLIQPYIPEMISSLKTTTNDSKKRHLLKLISLNKLPKKSLSFLLNYCLSEFTNAEQAVAIRVHAMQVLYGISELEPDFKHELIQLIEHEMEFHNSPGITSRGKKLLKKLSTQTS